MDKEYQRFAENVISVIKPEKNSKILEIGPGPGWAGINLVKRRNDILLDGLEPSEDMIRVAKENVRQEKLIHSIFYKQGMAENMNDIPDKSYDVVISRDSLHHWKSPHRVFVQIERILNEKGKVYIHDHRRDMGVFGKFIVTVIGKLFAGKMHKYWKSSIAASYTKEEIEELLNKLNLKHWIVKNELLNLVIIKIKI